jgi:hypothetical protein
MVCNSPQSCYCKEREGHKQEKWRETDGRDLEKTWDNWHIFLEAREYQRGRVEIV